jgi:transcriptional regulator with XRE-family HTH domain
MRNLIKETRKAKGWTQEELVRLSGLSYNTVVFAERGVWITKKTAAILSGLLGVTVKPIDSRARRELLTKRYLERQTKNGTAHSSSVED